MFNHGWWGLLWFVVKLWMFMFFFVWLRGSLPRVRYDQFMRFGWKFLIPVTLLWVVARRLHPRRPAVFFGDAARRRSATVIVVGVIARRSPSASPGSGTASARQGDGAAASAAGGDRPVRRRLPRPAAAGPAPARAEPDRARPTGRRHRRS